VATGRRKECSGWWKRRKAIGTSRVGALWCRPSRRCALMCRRTWTSGIRRSGSRAATVAPGCALPARFQGRWRCMKPKVSCLKTAIYRSRYLHSRLRGPIIAKTHLHRLYRIVQVTGHSQKWRLVCNYFPFQRTWRSQCSPERKKQWCCLCSSLQWCQSSSFLI